MTPGPSGPILSVERVSHAFGARQALRQISLEVRPGEIYALLGPNGAGKTTLVRAICGRLRPNEGSVRVAGRDPFADGQARAALGLAPQALALYPQLTVAENLDAFAHLAGLKGRAAGDAVRQAMDVTQTADRARSLVRHLSGGLQRRVNIAAAILTEPRLLVLDEPTVGVDLPAREAVSDALRRLRSEGTGVLLVTHDLDQAGCLADRAGFLREGGKELEGEPAELISEAFGERMEIEVEAAELGAGHAAILAGEGLARREPGGAWMRLASDGYAEAGRLAERLKARGVEVRAISVRRPSLQQLFALLDQGRRRA